MTGRSTVAVRRAISPAPGVQAKSALIFTNHKIAGRPSRWAVAAIMPVSVGAEGAAVEARRVRWGLPVGYDNTDGLSAV